MNILVLLLVFLCIAVPAELYYRTKTPNSALAVQYHWDNELGWDATIPVRPLYNTDAPSSVYFIGDSFTDSGSWPSRTQQEAIEAGLAFDGFVLGVQGYGTTQELLKLERHIQDHHPRVVVLLLFAWNDLRDNLRYPRLYYAPELAVRPFLEKTPQGFALRPTPHPWFHALLVKSAVYRGIVFGSLVRMSQFVQDLEMSLDTGEAMFIGYADSFAWKPFYSPDEQERPYVALSYEILTENLRRMRDLTSQHDAKLVVIGIDNAFTVDEDVRDAVFTEDERYDVDIPLEKIAKITQKLDIRFVSAVHELRTLHSELGKKVYNLPKGDISAHLEPEAEAVIAKIAWEEIRQALAEQSSAP